jgi:penicillin-binding protein activator
MNRLPLPLLPSLAFGAVLLGGCTASEGVPRPAGTPVTRLNPDERGFVAGTGVESQDLVAVSDQMARGLVGIPQIAGARTPPCVLLEPVVNATRFPIDKDLFLTRIRAELNEQAAGRIRFLDRAMLATLEHERDRKRTGQVAAGAEPPEDGFQGADFILTGELQGLSTQTTAGISDYILYTFHLTDARTGVIVWESSAEVKKQGLEDAAYR